MLIDDAGSHLAGGVQRIEGDQRAGDGSCLQQCADRRQLAMLVMKVEARQRHAAAVLDQRRSLVAHRAVAIGAANPLAVGRQRLPLRLLCGYWQPRLGIAMQRRLQGLAIGIHHHPTNHRFGRPLIASRDPCSGALLLPSGVRRRYTQIAPWHSRRGRVGLPTTQPSLCRVPAH